MKFLLIIFFLGLNCNSYSQSLWDIDLSDKEQFNKWVEVIDLDGSSYRQNDLMDFWGKAVFKNDSLEMKIKYPSKEQFNDAFMSIVNEFGEPSIFGDRDLKAEREKEENKGDYNKKKEHGVVDSRDLEAVIQSGDLLILRKWILVDYQVELLWDKNGIRFLCAYTNG